MKCLAILLFIIMLFGCAGTAKWSKADTNREIAFQILNAVDAGQTIYGTQSGKAKEVNPIMGRGKPEVVIPLKIGIGVLHYLFTDALPPEARPIWQWATITIQGGVVVWNFSQIW